MHLFSQESLAACFHALDGKKAVGVDGVSKAEYGERLESNTQGTDRSDEAHGLPPGAGTTGTDPQGG